MLHLHSHFYTLNITMKEQICLQLNLFLFNLSLGFLFFFSFWWCLGNFFQNKMKLYLSLTLKSFGYKRKWLHFSADDFKLSNLNLYDSLKFNGKFRFEATRLFLFICRCTKCSRNCHNWKWIWKWKALIQKELAKLSPFLC